MAPSPVCGSRWSVRVGCQLSVVAEFVTWRLSSASRQRSPDDAHPTWTRFRAAAAARSVHSHSRSARLRCPFSPSVPLRPLCVSLSLPSGMPAALKRPASLVSCRPAVRPAARRRPFSCRRWRLGTSLCPPATRCGPCCLFPSEGPSAPSPVACGAPRVARGRRGRWEAYSPVFGPQGDPKA